MKIKYQRTSTLPQHVKRFQKETNKYDMVLFDQWISGTTEFKNQKEWKGNSGIGRKRKIERTGC